MEIHFVQDLFKLKPELDSSTMLIMVVQRTSYVPKFGLSCIIVMSGDRPLPNFLSRITLILEHFQFVFKVDAVS